MKWTLVLVAIASVAATSVFAADRAYWRFEDGTAGSAAVTVTDISGNGNNGTAANGPLYYAAVAPTDNGPKRVQWTGKSNSLMLGLIAGSSQYFTAPDAASLDIGGTSFMIRAYVFLYADGSTGPCWFVQKKGAAGDEATDYGFLLGGGSYATSPPGTVFGKTSGATGTELVLLFGTGSAVQTVVSNLQITADNAWHFVGVSYDADSAQVTFQVGYDVDVVSTPGLAFTTNSADVVVGANCKSDGSGYDQFLDADIDEVNITDVARRPQYPTRKWFWEFDGRDLLDVCNADLKWAWDINRHDLSGNYTLGNGWWEIAAVPGEPGNTAFHVVDPDIQTRIYWDQTYGNDAISPPSPVGAATVVIRFKVSNFYNYRWGPETGYTGTPDPGRHCKMFRFYNTLGDASNHAKFLWEVGWENDAFNGATGIWSAEVPAGVTKIFRRTDDRFHRLHAVAFLEDNGSGGTQVHHKSWFDGVLYEDFVRTGTTNTDYFGPNDNPFAHTTDTYVDYMKHSVAGAFYQGDTDMDGDVDLVDFGNFSQCFNGPNRPAKTLNCEDNDLDGDGDVDLVDFGLFQGCFNGPNRAPKCM